MIYFVIILLFLIILITIKWKYIESIDSKYKYTAIIVEPREHPALEYVLQNFNDNLSNEWQFILFYGNKNKINCQKYFK